MHRLALPCCFAALVASSLAAQDADVAAAPPALLEELLIREATVQSLAVPPVPLRQSIRVELAGRPYDLDVWPNDIRSPYFQLIEDDGHTRRVLPTPPSVTVRGRVPGFPDSFVAGTVIGGELSAIVRLVRGKALHVIQPAGVHAPGRHVVFETDDNLPTPHRCGVANLQSDRSRQAMAAHLRASANNTICDIACDADVQFYSQNGNSTTNVNNDITSILNAVDVIYQRDTQITYRLGTVIVRTGSNPYSTNDPSGLLTQFRQEWNANQVTTPRDIAHLFTGRNLSGSTIGIARLNVICSSPGGYGLSQSRYTSNFSRRVALTAHELGHNWNAPHCNGDPDCAIMCASINGCNGIAGFGSASVARIQALRNRGCLGDGALPVLTQVNPSQVLVTFDGNVSILGSGLADARSVQVGAQTLNWGEFIILSDSQLVFTPDPPAALGSLPISVTTETGVTPTTGSLAYVPPPGPILDAPSFFVTNLSLPWEFLGDGDDLWFLVVGLNDNTTVPTLGINLLRNRIDLAAGTLSPLGQGSYSQVVPPFLLGFTIHSQLVTLDPATLTVRGASPVQATPITF